MAVLKYLLYTYSFASLAAVFALTVSTLALLGSSKASVKVICDQGQLQEATCSPCVGYETRCAFIYICGAKVLLGTVLWALYLMNRCRKPGILTYWKSK